MKENETFLMRNSNGSRQKRAPTTTRREKTTTIAATASRTTMNISDKQQSANKKNHNIVLTSLNKNQDRNSYNALWTFWRLLFVWKLKKQKHKSQCNHLLPRECCLHCSMFEFLKKKTFLFWKTSFLMTWLSFWMFFFGTARVEKTMCFM